MKQHKIKIINKQDVTIFLKTLIQDFELYAPMIQRDVVKLGVVKSPEEVVFNYVNTVNSVKEAVLPQSEALLRYTTDSGSQEITVDLHKTRTRVIFGIRPCDARSVVFLDKVFMSEDYRDPYYQRYREDMVLISIGCNKLGQGCFCNSVNGSPMSTEGSDVMLVDIGDEYAVQVLTDKGRNLISKFSLTDANENQLSRMNATITQAEKTNQPEISTDGIKEKLDVLFKDTLWDSLTEKCISCGVCTFLCPTCYCFDIVDETNSKKGARMRIWDSCQFPQFTLQASGFNPRPSSKERYRQRIMHKFSYCIDNQRVIGCVGCGRCVRECPVNLDIREILKAVQNA